MDLNLIEISQQVSPDGRRRARFALHEIYPDETQCNLNGITYLEEPTRRNANSVIGMPICATFLDENKDIPYDHGLTGQEEDMPVFEDSVQVGTSDGWSIDNIIVNGEEKRALICDCYINQQRYPLFVEWLEACKENGITVRGSVEFVGTKENGRIIYKDGKTQEDKYRVPIEYIYSAFCVITVKASDSTAIMVELNQLNNKETNQNNKEENLMDEKQMEQLILNVKNAVSETNSKNSEYETKIAELNSMLETKDAEIAELNAKNVALEEGESEKNKEVSELNAMVEKITKELNECMKDNAINELNSALTDFTDEEKKAAEAEINSFNEDFTKVSVENIIDKINASIGAKVKEKQIAEINAAKEKKADDIFSYMDDTDSDAKSSDLDGIFEI